MNQQEMSTMLPATSETIKKTPLSQQEWDQVNRTEPWVTGDAAEKVSKIQSELASYLDITPDQALLILVETICYRRLSE